MLVRQKADTVLSKARDWFDWYDNLVALAREYELEDLVDINNKHPAAENLLPKPEKPNPLALFPSLLDTLPIGALRQVVTPVVDEHGVAIKPAQYIFIRNQAIEDDALIHLTAAQAGGWRTRLSMHMLREKEWRQQRTKVLALRRWIDKHVDPTYAYRIKSIEEVRDVIKALQLIFPVHHEEYKISKEYRAVLEKAGPPLPAEEWLRQWNLAYGLAKRFNISPREDCPVAINDFLRAVQKYDPAWADIRLERLQLSNMRREISEQRQGLVEYADHFTLWLEIEKGSPDQGPQRHNHVFGTLGNEDEVGQAEKTHDCPCSPDPVIHKPQKCWYVRKAVTNNLSQRRHNKTRLNKTREALKEPQWAALVGKVKEICSHNDN